MDVQEDAHNELLAEQMKSRFLTCPELGIEKALKYLKKLVSI